MARINRENLLQHLIEKQFNLIERTTLDAIFNKNFKEEWSISNKQYESFKKYSISLIMKVLKITKKKAISNFEWIMEKYGLPIKD